MHQTKTFPQWKVFFIRLKRHPCVILVAFYSLFMSVMRLNPILRNAGTFNAMPFATSALIVFLFLKKIGLKLYYIL